MTLHMEFGDRVTEHRFASQHAAYQDRQLNRYENECSDASERLEWERENCPVVQLKSGQYYNFLTHRFISDKQGEKAVRAREEFYNPQDYHDWDFHRMSRGD